MGGYNEVENVGRMICDPGSLSHQLIQSKYNADFYKITTGLFFDSVEAASDQSKERQVNSPKRRIGLYKLFAFSVIKAS